MIEYYYVYCKKDYSVKSKNLSLNFNEGWNVVAFSMSKTLVSGRTITSLHNDVKWIFRDEFDELYNKYKRELE